MVKGVATTPVGFMRQNATSPVRVFAHLCVSGPDGRTHSMKSRTTVDTRNYDVPLGAYRFRMRPVRTQGSLPYSNLRAWAGVLIAVGKLRVE